MNFLAFYPEECAGEIGTICGSRAVKVLERHSLQLGKSIAALCINGERGSATLVSADPGRLQFSLRWDSPAPTARAIRLIVAVSRPQTIKKVLQAAAVFGVERLDFVRSAEGEKSYLQSKALSEGVIADELLLGIEQSGECRLPLVSVHRNFQWYMERHLADGTEVRFIADTARDTGPCDLAKAWPDGERDLPVTFAVGSEVGWSPAEIACFVQEGFRRVTLGERILRVEHAVVTLLGQFELLAAKKL